MQLNRANFLTWFNSASDVYNPLPVLNASHCNSPSIVWIVGDSMSFIINQTIGISLSFPYTLYLCSLDKTVLSTIGECTTIGSAISSYIVYGTFNCPSVAVGDYLLKISNESATYYSNKISIFDSSALINTAKFKFRHKFDKNDVEYTNTSLGSFYQQFRLFCSFGELNNQSSKEVINDIDSPTPREYNASVSMGYKCNIFSLDTDRHQAVQDMITCSHLEINGRRYQSDGSYMASPLGKSGISKGTFNVQDYSLRYAKR